MPAFQTLWRAGGRRCRPRRTRACCVSARTAARKITYASPRRWLRPVASAAPGSAEEAKLLAEFVTDYLRAHGPATPANFAKWLAAPDAWAATVFETLAGQGRIVRIPFAGGPAWLAADDLAFPGYGAGGSQAAAVLRRLRCRRPAPASCCSRAAPTSARRPAARPGTTRCS